jgi:large subunit ribosomal protein L9
LAPLTIRVEARAGGEGRLFGSVTAAEIAEAVYDQTGFEIDRRVIEIGEPIKSTGLHSVPAKLQADVKVFLQVDVSAR